MAAVTELTFTDIAKQFVEFYYNTFDTNRENLAALYRDNSMLTFESAPSHGATDILKKLTSLPFAKVVHKVDTFDAQPSNDAGGIMVMVTGGLTVDEQQKPLSYSQVFQLLPEAGSYFVFNDMFRIVYPA